MTGKRIIVLDTSGHKILYYWWSILENNFILILRRASGNGKKGLFL
jgi:hypothetical protein